MGLRGSDEGIWAKGISRIREGSLGEIDKGTSRIRTGGGLWVQEFIRERDIKGLQGSDGGLWAKGTFEDPTGVFWAKVIN